MVVNTRINKALISGGVALWHWGVFLARLIGCSPAINLVVMGVALMRAAWKGLLGQACWVGVTTICKTNINFWSDDIEFGGRDSHSHVLNCKELNGTSID